MATRSSILARLVPWTEEPCELLQSMGHRRVRHDLGTKQQQRAMPWMGLILFVCSSEGELVVLVSQWHRY